MNATIDLERRLATWLEQDGPADVPAVTVEAALARARTIRQQKAWLTRTWWDRRPLVVAAAGVEAGGIEPAERIPAFPVTRLPLRHAWVLVLLAALLAALVGGALLVGSQPARRLPAVLPPIGATYTCPDGTNPDEPGPVDQAGPGYLAWTPHPAFDRRAGKVVAVTGSADGLAPETWTFDVCTNSWTQMHPNREPPAFVHSYLVYDVDSDLTIGVPHQDGLPGRIWAYDLQANTWTEKGTAMGDPRFYDPVSGRVVAEAEGGLLAYDVETDTWTPIHEANGLQAVDGPQSGWMLTYDASIDRFIAYDNGGTAGARIWLFDIRTGTWSRAGVDPPVFVEGFWWVPAIAYDEATERTVFLGNVRWAAYDAAADRWELLGERSSLPGPLVYDAVNRRLVNVELGGRVVAFDSITREWTVLLEASPAQAAP